MKSLEEMALRFKSGNAIPVDRAWVKREEFEALEADVRELLHQRNLLGQAIADAAHTAGIYNNEVPLDGPQLLMMLEDLAEAAWKYNDLAD